MALDPTNRRAAAHLERILRETGRHDELLALYEARAERAQNRDDRTAAEVAAGELCQQMGRAGRRGRALPQGAGAGPQRAARPAGDPGGADPEPVLGGAGQGSGRGRAHPPRRARRRSAGRSGDAVLEAAGPAGAGGAVLPPGPQGGRVEPRDGRLLPRLLRGAERAGAVPVGAGAGAKDRARHRAARRDGDRDGARRRAAAAARRQGDRDLEGRAARAAAPARGRRVAEAALHRDGEVERAAGAAERRAGGGSRRRRRASASTGTSRSSGSTATV